MVFRLGQGRREKAMADVLNPTAEYNVWKKAFEKSEGKKHPKKKWVVSLLPWLFGCAGVGGLLVGGVKLSLWYADEVIPKTTYTHFKEEEKERRIAKGVVPQMPDDYKTVVFLFGDSVGHSIMAWSKYFGIDPKIVVAILCAENGSSLDENILTTVSTKFAQNPHTADKTVSRSDARGIAQIKPSTAEVTIKKLVREGKWPFQTTNINEVLSDYDMSIFLLCALIQEIQTSGYADIKNIAGAYHSGCKGWESKKAIGENDDEVWKQIKKAQVAMEQYEGISAYLTEQSHYLK